MKLSYVPEIYCDETSPPPRESADDWIVALDDGAPALAGEFSRDPPSALHDGDIVKFLEIADHGQAKLLFDLASGVWAVDPPMPQAAESVCALEGLQIETLSNDVEGVIDALKEMGEDGEFTLAYYSYSAPIPMLFDAGARRFTKMEAAQ